MNGRSPEDKDKQRKEFVRALSLLTQIGIAMAVCVFIGVFLGMFLDKLFGTSPWLLAVCSLLGVGASFKTLFDMTAGK